METVKPRTYRVKSADFPIAIVITAKNLPACRAVASAVQIIIDGNTGGTIPVDPVHDPAELKMFYSIPRSQQLTKADLVQVVNATFSPTAPTKSKYEVVITSAMGDSATTTISRPTINPAFAVLLFLLR